MAEKAQGGETIREMIAGFNSMQAQLGILPMQSASMPMGVSFTPPPPPPPVMHPSEVSMMAVQHQQAAMQNTMQTAQMTRYQPPPSAPIGGNGGMGGFGWGGTMASNAAQQMNPYMASALGGGAHGGMANPMFMTSSNFGMYRPQGGGATMGIGTQRLPPIFNPLAPQLPGANFMTPGMQNYQQMQGYQSWDAGIVAGKGTMLAGVAGSLGGSLIGGLFGGPIGSLAGGWAGEKIGTGLANFAIQPHMQDVRRARQIQNMTAGYINSGAHVNPFTGQGMDRESALQTAHGLRRMSNDYDFGRTGFNTADVMKITQLSSDQGLLATAQNPDEILRRVKDISKSVKVLMQITGDPDVRSVISSLGQMRNLGFSGLDAQSGAVANRVAFARMAGVSQTAMGQNYGMPGAMAAQQQGLVGATGYMAGMSGAAVGNMAIGAGAFSDLQIARGGGRAGISQTAMLAQLGAINQDIYLAAAVKRGEDGRLGVSADDYRRAQGLDLKSVANEAASNLRAIGERGAFELATRKQEFKDQLAQQMSPFEPQLNAFKQIRGIQRQVGHGITSGAAARMAGFDEDQSRTMELMMESTGTYDAMVDGLQQSKRGLRDRDRARREQDRTPGLLTRIGRGIRSGLAGGSEALGERPRSWDASFARVEEDRAAWASGERMVRLQQNQIARSGNANDSAFIGQAFRMGLTNNAVGGEMGGTAGNRLMQAVGWSSYNMANRYNRVANETEGSTFDVHTTFGDPEESRIRVADVVSAGRMAMRGRDMTTTQSVDTQKAIQASADALGLGINSRDLTQKVASLMNQRMLAATGFANRASAASGTGRDATIFGSSASALGRADSDAAMRSVLGGMGVNRNQMGSFMSKMGDQITAGAYRELYVTGDQKTREVANKAINALDQSGTLSTVTDPTQMMDATRVMRRDIGWDKFSDETLSKTTAMLADNEPLVIEIAAAKLAIRQGDEEKRDGGSGSIWGMKALGEKALADARKRAGGRFDELEEKAMTLLSNLTAHPEVQQALRNLVSSGKGQTKGLAAAVTEARGQAQIELGLGAQKQLLEKISSAAGPGVKVGNNLLEATKLVNLKDAKVRAQFTPGELKALEAGQATDHQGLADAMQSLGATSMRKLYGGTMGSDAEASIDAQIAEIDKLKGQVAGSKGTENPVQRLFATSVEVFASAAKDFKEGAEHRRLATQRPGVTSGAMGLDE